MDSILISSFSFLYSPGLLVTGKGSGRGHTSWNVWVLLDFVQERIQDMSQGDFESMFIKAWDSKTKKVFRTEAAESQE